MGRPALRNSQRDGFSVGIKEGDIVDIQVGNIAHAPAHDLEIGLSHLGIPAFAGRSEEEFEGDMARIAAFEHIFLKPGAGEIGEAVPFAVRALCSAAAADPAGGFDILAVLIDIHGVLRLSVQVKFDRIDQLQLFGCKELCHVQTDLLHRVFNVVGGGCLVCEFEHFVAVDLRDGKLAVCGSVIVHDQLRDALVHVIEGAGIRITLGKGRVRRRLCDLLGGLLCRGDLGRFFRRGCALGVSIAASRYRHAEHGGKQQGEP